MAAHIWAHGEHVEIEAAGNALEALRAQGVAVESGCNGAGTCARCWVLVEQNGERRWQLACQTALEDGMEVRADE